MSKTGKESLFTKFSLCNNFLEHLLTKTKSHNVPEIIQFAENVFVFNVTAGVPSQGGSADTAGETPDMPAQVIHL